jgi:hypothetical protein
MMMRRRLLFTYDASSEKIIFHYFRESDTGSLKDEKRHSAEVSFLFVIFKYLIGQTLKDRLIGLNVPKSGMVKQALVRT